MYEARVVNILLDNFNFGIWLQCRALPNFSEIFGSRSQAHTHQGSAGKFYGQRQILT